MNLPVEQQVTSRELSEELKKRGVPQNSLFYHAYVNQGNKFELEIISNEYLQELQASHEKGLEDVYSAYTMSELFYMLCKSTNNCPTYYNYESYTPNNLARDVLYDIDSGFLRVCDL